MKRNERRPPKEREKWPSRTGSVSHGRVAQAPVKLLLSFVPLIQIEKHPCVLSTSGPKPANQKTWKSNLSHCRGSFLFFWSVYFCYRPAARHMMHVGSPVVPSAEKHSGFLFQMTSKLKTVSRQENSSLYAQPVFCFLLLCTGHQNILQQEKTNMPPPAFPDLWPQAKMKPRLSIQIFKPLDISTKTTESAGSTTRISLQGSQVSQHVQDYFFFVTNFLLSFCNHEDIALWPDKTAFWRLFFFKQTCFLFFFHTIF